MTLKIGCFTTGAQIESIVSGQADITTYEHGFLFFVLDQTWKYHVYRPRGWGYVFAVHAIQRTSSMPGCSANMPQPGLQPRKWHPSPRHSQ